jgi:hypothetical protein
MPRKSVPLTLEEISGDRFPDLETAQRLALQPLALALADTLRGLLAAGTLALEDGQIIVAQPQEDDPRHE